MKTISRNFLSLLLLLALAACNLGGAANPAVFQNPALRLTVQTQNNVTTYSQVGEIINYQYVITNTGTTPLAGPVIVNDSPRVPACPGLNTVGNQDNYLDQNETVTCIAAYSVTESDVNTGSITNVATATAGSSTSNQTGITLTRGTPQPSGALTLAKTASTQTYGAANETITFTFNLTNTGTTPLGPAQFTVTDNRLGAPFNCGPADTTLAPSQSVSCSVPYIVTTADMGQANITNSAIAAGAGQTSAAATVTVVNLLAPATATPPTPITNTPGSPSNLAPGSTIQHQVAIGEWLIQIGRCYGANFEELRNANRQIADPDFILPAMSVTVPRIGSAGRIYGPPCVTFHTVQSGDTFEALAQRYNADIAVLRLVNPGGLVAGQQAKIPLNSAGGGGVVVTAIPPTGGVTPGVTGVPPMRITFDAGSTTASRTGFVIPGQTLQYLVAAQQGQTLTIQLTAPPNEVTIGVNGPTGLALKPSDSNYTWTTNVLNTGDHTINLASLTGGSNKSYTLQVSLTNPTPPTATNTPITPVP